MVGRRGFLGAAGLGLFGVRTGTARGQVPKESGAAGAATKPAGGPSTADERVNRELEQVRARHNLPGMVGAVLKGETVAAIGATGVRKLGSSEAFRVTDRVHIGSDTKAMTATLLAMLVEQGKLDWSSTIRKVFPARSRDLYPDFKDVNLWQLLTHRAGLPANGPWRELKGRTTTEKRRDLLSRMMKDAPLSKPGTTYAYSNVGYAIAGLMAEQVSDDSWEDLMRERLFKPLGMTTAGFGAPGTPGKVDEPWGHHTVIGKVVPAQGDNAPALGPAGTVHCSTADWAKFVALHLQGERGNARLLKPETFRFLHAPAPGTEYGGGWLVVSRPWAGGRALTHSGSNTMWYCTVWVAPARDFAVMVTTNQGDGGAAGACDEAVGQLIGLAQEKAPGG